MGRQGMSVLLAACLAFAAGCRRPVISAQEPEAKAGSAAVSVNVVKLERKTLRRVVEQPGTVEAFEQTPLFTKIAGFVRTMHKDLGDRVRKDELLAELWVPELEEELKQKDALITLAAAEVEQAQAALRAAAAHYETSAAQVQEAEAGRSRSLATFERWQSEYKRVQEMVTRRVIDEQTRDETLNQLKAADAARAEVEAKVRSAQAARDESVAKRDKAAVDVRAADARKKVAEADQRHSAALLAYARITAPFDGVVTRRNVDSGHLLQPAAAGGAKGEPLFIIARTDRVRVFVDVPEADATAVKDGTTARIRIPALKGKEFAGKVTRTAFVLDPKSRTLRTEIDFPNPNGELRPGMYASAGLTVERVNVWTLPAAAVLGQGENMFVWRVEGGKAVRTHVRVGVREGQTVEILKKRTRAGDAAWEEVSGMEEIVNGAPPGFAEGQVIVR